MPESSGTGPAIPGSTKTAGNLSRTSRELNHVPDSIRARKVEAEVMTLLHARGYLVSRVSTSSGPRLIAAIRGNSVLFVMGIRSRHGITGAQHVGEKYPVEVALLRWAALGDTFTKQLWIWVAHEGWRMFEILPGGTVEVRNG
ncbi:hypothetical protein [Methanoregula sp.]|uniref:hypothetical protein n=1 Tax=Methanoregula sp. TaxID=2052170 RepID=UPI000CC4F4B8|nr:hypothetical protein [Methanoregula sp.]PKG31142.1 MAG: hypothetical protein CW742_14950 [Methanoregula sp.]